MLWSTGSKQMTPKNADNNQLAKNTISCCRRTKKSSRHPIWWTICPTSAMQALGFHPPLHAAGCDDTMMTCHAWPVGSSYKGWAFNLGLYIGPYIKMTISLPLELKFVSFLWYKETHFLILFTLKLSCKFVKLSFCILIINLVATLFQPDSTAKDIAVSPNSALAGSPRQALLIVSWSADTCQQLYKKWALMKKDSDRENRFL